MAAWILRPLYQFVKANKGLGTDLLSPRGLLFDRRTFRFLRRGLLGRDFQQRYRQRRKTHAGAHTLHKLPPIRPGMGNRINRHKMFDICEKSFSRTIIIGNKRVRLRFLDIRSAKGSLYLHNEFTRFLAVIGGYPKIAEEYMFLCIGRGRTVCVAFMLQGKSLGRHDQRVPADFRVHQINLFKDITLSHPGSYFRIKISNIYRQHSIRIH